MAPLSMTYSDTANRLTLRGDLSEVHADELRIHLLRGIDRASRLVVDCEQVTSIDMVCLKLLCTAYRVSHMLKKDFVLAADRSALFRRSAEFVETAHCAGPDRECGHGCLWTDGGNGRYRPNDSLEALPGSDVATA
jgi:anti-anti-sigma regulatory factor